MNTNRPKCAQNMAQRLAALKKDEEIDGLRVYLIKYNLFPRNRDPLTSPIRVEELKELVKHWKLHRQRGFWRDHPEKDDLVRALLQFIKHEADNKKRRQDAQDKYRGKVNDKYADDDAHGHSHSRGNEGPQFDQGKVQIFKAEQRGDIFYQHGCYDDGMIYLSRMEKPKTKNQQELEKTAAEAAHQEAIKQKINGSDATDREAEKKASRDLKLKCAESVYHLSYYENNELQMLQEGVMQTIIGLVKGDDVFIRLYCSASIINLAVSSETRAKMVDDGVLQAALELARTNDEDTKYNCALILFRFSCEEQFHFRMVQEGCALTLMQLMTGSSDLTKEACMKALINLAALPRSTLSDSIMNCLLHLAESKNEATRLSCARGLLNMSIMATTRISIVEDGAITALRSLVTTPTDEMQELVSCILCNLAAIRTNQELMVKYGAISMLNDLLQLPNETVKQQTSITLSYLSCNPRLQPRIVSAGFTVKLAALLLSENTETQKHVTLCFSNLASHYNSRTRIVQDNTVPILMETMLKSKDLTIKQDCVVTLCNLMLHPRTYKTMVEQGVVPALIKLSDSPDEEIQRTCALALLNLSCDVAMQVKIVEEGVVSSLVNLTANPNVEVRQMCITTLYNLSQQLENAQCLLYEGTVGVIVMFLNDIVDAGKAAFSSSSTNLQRLQCCAILCNLSNFEKGRQGMMDVGSVDAIVRVSEQLSSINFTIPKHKNVAAHDMDIAECIKNTRAYAAGALCNLSSVAMTYSSYFQTLLTLTYAHDPVTTLRCALAFSSISSSPTGRKLLANNEDIAPGLNAMMRSGYHETQVNAAIALCNLARERGTRSSLWKEGTVADFIVIALLRINSDDTKEICAKVLFNLLSHTTTRDDMMREGVLYALIKLAKLERSSVREMCIRAIYNISLDDDRLQDLIDNEIVRVVFGMYNQDYSLEMKRLMCGILSSLSSLQGNEIQMVHEGILKVIKCLIKIRDPESRAYCANVLCNLSCNDKITEIMVKEGIIPLLITLSRSENKDIRRCSAGAMCNISANSVARSQMVDEEIVPAVVDLMQKGSCRSTNTLCARTLHNLCLNREYQHKLVQTNTVQVFNQILSSKEDAETLSLCTNILCTLTSLEGLEQRLVHDGIVRALVSVIHANSNQQYASKVMIISALSNLSTNRACHTQMLNDGVVEGIVIMAGQDPASLAISSGAGMKARKSAQLGGEGGRFIPITYNMDEQFSFQCAIVLRNLSTASEDASRAKITSQAGAIRTCMALAQCPNNETRENTAVTIYNLSCYKRSRAQIINFDGVKTLIRLATNSSAQIKNICALALHGLSTHDANIMQGGLVSSLASLAELNSAALESASAGANLIVENIHRSELQQTLGDEVRPGIERTSRQIGASEQWTTPEVNVPEMPAFSICETHENQDSKPTPPRHCTYDLVLGEVEYMKDSMQKIKVLMRQPAKQQATPSGTIPEEAVVGDHATIHHSSSLPVLPDARPQSPGEKVDNMKVSSSVSDLHATASTPTSSPRPASPVKKTLVLDPIT